VNSVNDQKAQLPYEQMGGGGMVRRFVDRFYDLMDTDPRYAELRSLHAADLQPMRESLAGFLSAWLGGPRDWFDQRPGACVMSAHAKIPVTRETAEQWTDAMARALADSGIDAALAERVHEAFQRMAMAMARRKG
jgi:hemoglobin